EATFAAVPDQDLVRVMERFLEFHCPSAENRNSLQDWLWVRQRFPVIPKKARRDLARAINIENLFIDATRFDALLDGVWVLSDSAGIFFGDTLRDHIEKHVHRNRGDWSTEELFEKLGAFEATDRRFALFLEGLVSPDVLPDEPAQRRFVDAANG